MQTKFGLTDEHIEQLANGERVEFIVPGLRRAGENTTVVLVPAERDEIGGYANILDLAGSIE